MGSQTTIIQIDDVLVVPMREDIDDHDVLDLQDELSAQIVARRARGVVIDISNLEIVDTFVGRILGQLAKYRAFWMPRPSWWGCGLRWR